MPTIQLKTFAVFTMLTILSLVGYSQAPTIQWQKSFGGNADDFEKNVQQSNDGGYIVGGWTLSNNGDVSGNHGNIDYWIVKLDSSRNIEWQKCLGGSNDDEGDGDLGGMVIEQTKDSGYIVAANTKSTDGDITSNHGGVDYWIVKLNATGNIQWQKTLGGTKNDVARSVQQTSDSGYIVAGSALSNDGDVTGNHGNEDYWIVKLDNLGNLVWQKSLGGSGSDNAFSIKQTKDNNYVIAGYSDSQDGDITNPLGDWDYWIVTLDNNGSIIWQKSYGGTSEDYATDVVESNKGGYVVTGYTLSHDGDVTTAYGGYDSWILKISNVGNIEWQKSLGGSGDDAITNVQQSSDNNYVVAQTTSSNDNDISGNHGGFDSWLVKLDTSGKIIWGKIFGGSNDDFGTSVQQTKDEGYIVGNYSASNDGDVTNNKGANDYWIVKLKSNDILPLTFLSLSAQKQPNGVLLNWKTANEINNSYFDIEKSKNGYNFFTIGSVPVNKVNAFINTYNFVDTNLNTNTEYYRVKQVDKDGKFSFSKTASVTFETARIKFYPNPSKDGKFTIELPTTYHDIKVSVTDEAGKIIYNKSFSQTNNINLSLPNTRGIYFAKIKYNNIEENFKMIIN